MEQKGAGEKGGALQCEFPRRWWHAQRRDATKVNCSIFQKQTLERPSSNGLKGSILDLRGLTAHSIISSGRNRPGAVVRHAGSRLSDIPTGRRLPYGGASVIGPGRRLATPLRGRLNPASFDQSATTPIRIISLISSRWLSDGHTALIFYTPDVTSH